MNGMRLRLTTWRRAFLLWSLRWLPDFLLWNVTDFFRQMRGYLDLATMPLWALMTAILIRIPPSEHSWRNPWFVLYMYCYLLGPAYVLIDGVWAEFSGDRRSSARPRRE